MLQPKTLIAFALAGFLAGGNAVAIRISNEELVPMWGAAVRFFFAAVILFAVVRILRLSLPRGRALIGASLYGLLNFGLAFGFIYWGLLEVTAGTAMVVLATVPLLTLIFAVIFGLERLTLRGIAGALVAASGIVLIFRDSISSASPASMTALLCGAASMAASPIVVKTFPRVHAVCQNAVGMLVGSAMLLLASWALVEPHGLPVNGRTQLALAYLVILGSIGVFLLFMYLLRRMTASATNYIMLIAPLAAVFLGSLLLSETIGAVFLVGSGLVLCAVFIGALMGHKADR